NGLDLVGANHVYAKSSPTFKVLGPTRMDLFAETIWNPGVGAANGSYGPRQAAPFALLDTIYQAERFVQRTDPAITFPPLKIAWSAFNVGCRPCPLSGAAAIAAGQIGT